MIIRKFCLVVLVLSVAFQSIAQLGGNTTYSFLNLPFSSRSAALGGGMLPIMDKDVTLAINNPSLLNPQMHNYVNLSISNYLADIQLGSASYAHKLDNGVVLFGGIQYVNFGQFIRTDEFGNQIGTFHAEDYSLNVAGSKQITDYIYGGIGVKLIYSTYEAYTSFGLAADLAVSYHNPDKLLTTSFVVNNLGFQLQSYNELKEPLPLNVQLGISKKLEHAPLRFITVIHHLNDLDFTYIDPNKTKQVSFDNFGEAEPIEPPFSEKVFRHFIFAGEFVMSENFHLRIGYNHQRRKEMQIESRPGMVGYSFGFGLRISKFHLSYSNSIYHFAGSSHAFSLSTNFSEYFKKDKVIVE